PATTMVRPWPARRQRCVTPLGARARNGAARETRDTLDGLAAVTRPTVVGNDFGGLDILVDDHAKEGAHHFFPGHLTVIHGPIRIRVELVVGAIIKMTVDVKLRSFGY